MTNTAKAIVAFVVLLLLGFAAYVYYSGSEPLFPEGNEEYDSNGLDLDNDETAEYDTEPRVVADGLSVPWDIAFLPDGRMLVTERGGRLLLISFDGDREEVIIPDANVQARGEGGLLGIVLHPDFGENGWLYLYMTGTESGRIVNNVIRYRWQNDGLTDLSPIVENIPGSINHDGGRIEFGPDGYLYIATGDAGNGSLAQDTNSLAGKILRVTDDGSIPADNPFDNAVYSLGHRNPQGLAWDASGRLWSTEHGRSGALSGLDEINLIERGANYGWPDSEGDTVASGTIAPARHSGATTWAPASAAYVDGSLFFGGLRGAALYEAVLNGAQVTEVREHFKNEYGRIRTVLLGPDGYLYFTTSNRDGRGSARSGDDKIIRIHPSAL